MSRLFMKTVTNPIPLRLAAALALAAGLAAPAFALAPAEAIPSASAMAVQPWMDSRRNPDQRAALLLAQMSQDEKFQMLHSYFGLDSDKGKRPEGALGSAGYVPGIARLGIPAQQIVDAGMGVTNPGGVRPGDFATAMPSALVTASSWNPQMAYDGGVVMGREAWQQGFNVLLAGGANLQRDPRNGRNFEYLGEDPLLTGTLAGESIRGVQSQHVVSTTKHYAMNDLETRRNFHDAVIDQQAMRESDLLAFELAIERGQPGSVMCSYNHTNGVYGCEHDYLLNQVLKQQWRFPGYVMSDWGGVHSAGKAALAGLDQQSAGEVFDKEVFFDLPLRNAVAAGEVPQSRIDEMVQRILRSLIAVGALDQPPQRQPIDGQAGLLSAQRITEDGAVLLRNEHNTLPLQPNLKHVLVIGGHADKGVLSGGGSSHIEYTVKGENAVPGLEPTGWPGPVVYHPSSPLQALRQAMPNTRFDYLDGSDPAAAAAAAKSADAVLVFATQWAAESVDLPDMQLPDDQDALISAVAAANPHISVILETNGPVRMPWLAQVPAVMEVWYPGIGGGPAIANLLTGKVNPSGHLPVTWPVDESQLPRPSIPGLGFHPAQPGGDVIDYTLEGANVGYKWFATKGLQPQYAFGHGLSYTRFEFSNLKLQVSDDQLSASFQVRNTGKRAGAAVPQLYVQLPDGHATPLRLVGWQKLELQPGESRSVTVQAEPRTLANFDTNSQQWKIAAGRYQLELARAAGDEVEQQTFMLEAKTLDP